jgi:hypothetical protein
MQGLSAARPIADNARLLGTASLASASLASTPPCSIESRRLSACADVAEAWTALGKRAVAANPFFEPGFLLPAAQHLVAFRDTFVLLVWQNGAAGQDRRLVGLMPYRRTARMLRGDSLTGCEDDRLLCDWPLLDRDAALPAARSLLRALQANGLLGNGLRLRALARDNPLLPALTAAAGLERLTISPGFSPPRSRAPTASPAPRPALQEAKSQSELRDGVEILMAIEASGPLGRVGGAAVQDNREAAFLRAMSRGMARGKLCRITLLIDSERPVAAALTLGRGKRRWVYKAVAEGAEGPETASERLTALLTTMQEESAGLELLANGDWPMLGGPEGAAIRDLTLEEPPPPKPVDLARRLRARLDRGLFRLRP